MAYLDVELSNMSQTLKKLNFGVKDLVTWHNPRFGLYLFFDSH